MTKVRMCLFISLQLRFPVRAQRVCFLVWKETDGSRESRLPPVFKLCRVIGEANGCLSSFAWPPVIKAPLRHFKRPAYASSSYVPSVPKKTDEHPARYKMLDQRIKLKKIQNISHNWNRK